MTDPRPYNFQYRKPRHNNPTFYSSSVYKSLYHLRIPQRKDLLMAQQNPQLNQRKSQMRNPEIARNTLNPEEEQSQSFKSIKHQQKAIKPSVQTNRIQAMVQTQTRTLSRNKSVQRQLYNRISSNERIREKQQYPRSNSYDSKRIDSHLSNYGQNLMKSAQLDRFTIFEKQQKGYNIISCYPKEMTSSLKIFPKLTLENKLIESGRYLV